MLDHLERTWKKSPTAVPYDFVESNEKVEPGPELDPAPTVGRTLTLAVARYLPIANNSATEPPEKIQRAEQILSLAREYLTQFPQTHEIPRNSDRAHDRTPGGQDMAPYYGPANDVHFAQAMKLINEDTSLPGAIRDEAIKYSNEMRLRLLTYADPQGHFPQRNNENFEGENSAYQILMGLTLQLLPLPVPSRPSTPSARLLQTVNGR